MEIVLVNTKPKYGDQYYVDNIVHMLDNSKTTYHKMHVIDDVVFGGVYDKLRIFDKFKTGQYLYLDLDIIIKGNINHLAHKDFTLLHAWWRAPFHTPLNSSIMSWSGDQSHIYNKFNKDPEYYITKYNKGIDEYIFKEIYYDTYPFDTTYSNKHYSTTELDYPIVLFNQDQNEYGKGWSKEYIL